MPRLSRARAPRLVALLGLALGVLIVSACGSTAAPSTKATEPSAMAASVGPSAVASVKPSVVASVPATQALTSSMTPEARIGVPNVGWLASDGTKLWVFAGGQVARLNPAKNAIGALATVDATHKDGGFAVNRQGLWLNDFDANLVLRVDPASLKVVAKIAAGPNPEGLAVDPKNGAVWVANHRGGTVARIDPATNTVVATIPTGHAGTSGPHQIGLGLGSVWVGVPNTLSVYRIDPVTNTVVATIHIPLGASACGGFTFSEKAVWMPSCFDATKLVRIDPVANKVVATIQLGGYGENLVLVDGFPWLVVENKTDGQPGRLVRIDPTTNTVDRVVSLGDSFTGGSLVMVAERSMWAVDWANGQIQRLPLAAFNR
jgi:YVTN family beta-propeller protein